jgi:MoaA/NifB/PqqE/SkfB family radical SAM enzyme
VEQLAALGTEKISYTGGEPTLHPQLPEIVAVAHEMGLRQVITTNGDSFAGGLPSWLAVVEHVKTSFYGDNARHDHHMGAGHFDFLLDLVGRIHRQFDIPVSANYMLTPDSTPVIPEFLVRATAAGIHDVVFQTYIHTGRVGPDQRFALPDHRSAADRVGELSKPFGGRFPGGLRLHDYALDGWFVVLDEVGRFTLPTSGGGADFTMGRCGDHSLRLPDGRTPTASDALAEVWRARAGTPAIVDLTPPG